MKNQDIVKRIARQSGVSRGEAADRVERVVHQLVADLRHGKKTSLPGLGTFFPDGGGHEPFEREGGEDAPPQD